MYDVPSVKRHNMKTLRWSDIVLALLLCILRADGFYMDSPVEFKIGQNVDVKAMKMTSFRTQLPYDYYSLPFCLPQNGSIEYKSQSFGEVLLGDRIVNTGFRVAMGEDVACTLLCNGSKKPIHWNEEDSRRVIERIQHEYSVHLLIDNLPVVTKKINDESDRHDVIVYHGYKLGEFEGDEVYINNYLKLKLSYHKDGKDAFSIVGFEIEARSVDSEELPFDGNTCVLSDELNPQYVNTNGTTSLFFLYSVEWTESDVPWSSRWDIYLDMNGDRSHWHPIFIFLIVGFLISGIITMIMIRIRTRESLACCNRSMEETSYKLIHGDLFRSPKNYRLFAALVGNGSQIFCASVITILLVVVGLLPPTNPGALVTCAIFVYVFSGPIGGYVSACLYRTMGGTESKLPFAATLTTGLYPGVVFTTCYILNALMVSEHSSGAVSFATLFESFCVWFGILGVLVYIAYLYRYRKQPFTHPVQTNELRRQVPAQSWYMNLILCTLVAGLLPFGAVYNELPFIFTALWKNQYYNLFGILFLTFCTLVTACCQMSILMVYFQLRKEDYRWWWRSFVVGGGSAIYILGYAVSYFVTELNITEVIPSLIYFGYTVLMVFTYWVLTGTVGFVAAYVFVRQIYASVKMNSVADEKSGIFFLPEKSDRIS